jgi:hypothetical protein
MLSAPTQAGGIMNVRILAVAAILATPSFTGCVTAPEAQANAAAQTNECKVVSIDNTRQELRMQNQKGTDGTPMDQTEGQVGTNRAARTDPKALRAPTGRVDNLASRALRDC